MDSKRLNIGFLSHEFRHCVVSHLMAALFGRFDRQRLQVLGFDYSPSDDSVLRQRITYDCDKFISVRGMPPRAAAKRIAAESVHVLVDINSYMVGGIPEIAAFRPAPVQVSYMYPATMGAPWIDYFLTDRFVTPAGEEQYFTEKLVYLPDAYLPTDCDQPIADQFPSRTECGLGEEGFVYCSFNSADKLDPMLFDTWMRILRAVPGSVLWQRGDEPAVQLNLRREAEMRGVDPSRLVFAPSVPNTADHLARHRHADLFLDTVLHSGHGTVVDALWAGVSVLACPGQTFASRVSGSLLQAAGLPELIVRNLEEYERLAIELGRQPERLAAIRRKLAAGRSSGPLFDAARLARQLEAAFSIMWQNGVEGRAPESFSVG